MDYAMVMEDKEDGTPQYHVHEKDGNTLGNRLSSHEAPEDALDKIKELRKQAAGIKAGEESDQDNAAEEAAETPAQEAAEGGMSVRIVPDDFIAKREDVSTADKKRAEKEYGDVKFADEKNKKYPIDTEEHIRAAWNYINKSGNAGKYEAGEVESIKRKIIAAWKSKIDKDGPPSESDNHSMFVIDSYVSVKPGEPYRLFPFGVINKGGVQHVITPDYAAKFKLPHFKPPIKLGSHEDATPAGGTIAKLEVRPDGLYAYPEMTPKGEKAISDGDYRYHSPEVLWEDGVIEDPKTGELMAGPFIVGDALLHTPHLGEDAAMYSIEPLSKENLQMDHSHEHTHADGTTHSHSHMHADDVDHDEANHNHNHEEGMNSQLNVKREEWDAFQAFKKLLGIEPKPENGEPEKYAALVAENTAAKERIDKMESERAHEKEVLSISKDLKADKFGAMFKDEAFRMEAAEVFSSMNAKQREWVLRRFSAMAGQIDLSNKLISKEFGTESAGNVNPIDAFTAMITEKQKEKGFEGAKNYVAALRAVRNANPELAADYDAEMKRRARIPAQGE